MKKYISDIPNYVLRNLLVPKGIRLPKVERIDLTPRCADCRCEIHQGGFEHKSKPGVKMCWSCKEKLEPRRSYYPHYGVMNDSNSRMGDNLDNAWYRFFVGENWKESKLSECRCCRETQSSEESRRTHKDAKFSNDWVSCQTRLTRAYKLLLKERLCLVCYKETARCVWGVPLCGFNCDKAWKISKIRWQLLIGALAQEKNERVKAIGEDAALKLIRGKEITILGEA